MPAPAPLEQRRRGLVAHAAAAVASRRSRARRAAARAGGPTSTTTATAAGRPRSCIHACRCASRTTIRRPAGRPSPARLVETTASGAALAAPSECAASPAAMFACGRSSTTSGARSSDTSPSICERPPRRFSPRLAVDGRRPPAPMRRRADAADARRCLAQPRLADRPRRAPRWIALDSLLAQVVAEQQRVDAGLERAAPRRARCRPRRSTAFISSASAITTPVEAELVAEQAGARSPG